MPTCTKCKEDKPDSEFRIIIKRGRQYTVKHCNDCQREYVRNHYYNNQQVYVDKARKRTQTVKLKLREKLGEYLKNNPCADCGECDIRVLQFDHTDHKDKKYSISYMIQRGFSWETVIKEIRKCQVRCANCHIKRTATQFNWWNSEMGN